MNSNVKQVLYGVVLLCALSCPCLGANADKGEDGNGAVRISGELKQWHTVTLTLDGPWAKESGAINPFTGIRMTVSFRHISGSPRYTVPGYFAADGQAAHSSAQAGNQWRAHLSPDKAGTWYYQVSLVSGAGVAVDPEKSGEPISPYHSKRGRFKIDPTDKTGSDLRGKGRLQYVGMHYLRFAGSGEYFLKGGADSPENFLAYDEIDVMMNGSRRGEMTERAGGGTSVPQIFINGEHVGGCDELMMLEHEGNLDGKLGAA